MAQKIGILGGAFDPVHIGHMIVASSARMELGLDLLLFVPNALSPLKSSGPAASFEHRLAMLRLVVEGFDGYGVSDIEGRRGGI
jgi:nicotinate-nucleotide adenylyltransferase